MSVFDVFDRTGHLRQKLQVQGPAVPGRDNVYFLDADRVVVVTGALDAYRSMQGVSGEEDETATAEEPAPLEVICYTLGQ
jgi:hypothetical protein